MFIAFNSKTGTYQEEAHLDSNFNQLFKILHFLCISIRCCPAPNSKILKETIFENKKKMFSTEK